MNPVRRESDLVGTVLVQFTVRHNVRVPAGVVTPLQPALIVAEAVVRHLRVDLQQLVGHGYRRLVRVATVVAAAVVDTGHRRTGGLEDDRPAEEFPVVVAQRPGRFVSDADLARRGNGGVEIDAPRGHDVVIRGVAVITTFDLRRELARVLHQ